MWGDGRDCLLTSVLVGCHFPTIYTSDLATSHGRIYGKEGSGVVKGWGEGGSVQDQ